MNHLDDTNTNLSFDDADEDKTLFLNGTERLRYFREVSRPKHHRAQSSHSFLHRLLSRFRRH